MRLQLSPTQIASFAGKVGSLCSIDLKTSIQMVLAEFAKDLDPFSRKDLTAVLREAGFPTDLEKDPEAWATVSAEIKRYTSNTSEKGFYTQKGSTVPRPATPSRFAPPEPFSKGNSANPGELDGVEVKEVEGVFWSPLQVGASDEIYDTDMGLRRIAVSQSACFGNYSTRAAPCQSCPLASFCVQASISNLPGLVASLDEATNTEIKNAIAASVRARTPSPINALIDALLGIPAKPVEAPRPAPATPAKLDLSAFPKGTSIIPIPIEVVCTGCSHPLLVDSEGVHIPARGLFHIACAKAA